MAWFGGMVLCDIVSCYGGMVLNGMLLCGILFWHNIGWNDIIVVYGNMVLCGIFWLLLYDIL